MAFAHAYAELAALETPSGTVDSVDYWVTMGDAIHEAHIRAILAKRSPDQEPPTFYDRFGTTELGWGLVVQPRTLSSERSDRRVGKPDPVAEVAVLRPDGSRAPVGEVGFFGAKGPSITAGYWNDSDTTYRSKLGGYWLTGDLVYQDEDGNYYVVDRTKDAIETAEGTGYSVLMEEVLLSEISAITDCRRRRRPPRRRDRSGRRRHHRRFAGRGSHGCWPRPTRCWKRRAIPASPCWTSP